MIRVSSTNWYVGNNQPKEDAKFWATLGCDVGGVQEGHGGNAQDIKAALKGSFEVIWGIADGLGERDVPVIVSRKIHVLKAWSRQISKRVQKENIGMQRNAQVVRFIKNGKRYRIINAHTMAAVQNPRTRVPYNVVRLKRAYEFMKGMVILEAMIRRGKRKGDIVIVTGDLNYFEQKVGVWKFSPQAVFKRTGLNYKVHGVDYIAWDENKLSAYDFTVIPTTQTGSDHPWIYVDLELKKG